MKKWGEGMERPDAFEISIVRDFTRQIWHPFQKGLQDYEMVRPGDRIAVGVSGGVDSLLLAKCMRRQARYSHTPFEVVCVTLDTGKGRALLDANAERLSLPLEIIQADSAGVSALCDAARALHCSKLALGQHFDDITENILAGMLFAGKIAMQLPQEECGGVRVIRPLCLVRERDILAWQAANALECPPPDPVSDAQLQAREIIARIHETSPAADRNIFRAMENVNLNTVISYTNGAVSHHFLDDFASGITNHGTRSGEGR